MNNKIDDILANYHKYIEIVDPIYINNSQYSSIINRRKYKRALEIIDQKRNDEQINKAVEIINQTIEKIKTTNNIYLINNILFAIGSPKSYDLIEMYYNELIKACKKNKSFVGYEKGRYGLFTKNPAAINDRIQNLKLATLTLFTPIMVRDDVNELQNTFNINLLDIKKAIENYKKQKSYEVKYSDRDVAHLIYREIIAEKTLEELCKKYKISEKAIHKFLSDNLKPEEYRDVLDRLRFNSTKRFYAIKDTIQILFDLVPTGITTGDKIIPFTLLDYYSITNQKILTILEHVSQIKPNERETAIRKAKVKEFLQKNKLQGSMINREMAERGQETIVNKNGKFQLIDYYDEIYETFKEHSIPNYHKLYSIALSRIANNLPVLPLIRTAELEESIHI